jgi:hypothetical protein
MNEMLEKQRNSGEPLREAEQNSATPYRTLVLPVPDTPPRLVSEEEWRTRRLGVIARFLKEANETGR